MKALVVVQCFPPLLKNAGGVSKRYFTLCRALIDGLGWQVTLMTPVDCTRSSEKDIKRWIAEGKLVHLPARGVRVRSSTDGVAVFLDLFSYANAAALLRETMVRGGYDCLFLDDVPWRLELLLLTRALGIPTVVSSHTDITHMKAYKGVVKLVWKIHMLSTRLASVHATVSRVFGAQMGKTYGIPISAIWPPILWSEEFKAEPAEWADQAQALRSEWLEKLRAQGCQEPRAILLSAGRWSAEKRIHLLWEALPKDCALVIVGDGTSGYCQTVMNAPASGRPNVLPLRKMLNGKELRAAYAASDLFVSASNFETLGNTVIEALCSGTPCALQPAQGHLEFVRDGENSWLVDFDDADEARAKLQRIVHRGLDAVSLQKAIPDFEKMGRKLRTSNFARDFDECVLQKALAEGNRVRSLLGWLLEICKRSLAMILCVLLFFFLRTFTRIAFITSADPQFEVLGQLGGAVDDGRGKSVWTFPCMRIFSSCEARDPAAASAAEEGTDYESHFRPARRRPAEALEVFEPGVGGSMPSVGGNHPEAKRQRSE
ncbi:SQD2 [Symbiodinium microadriaticum]|nr:SQD2 [Symbiodinium microadriaticum]CAE7874027.1 SQD2 [Symbiodinium sp. KB8]